MLIVSVVVKWCEWCTWSQENTFAEETGNEKHNSTMQFLKITKQTNPLQSQRSEHCVNPI